MSPRLCRVCRVNHIDYDDDELCKDCHDAEEDDLHKRLADGFKLMHYDD